MDILGLGTVAMDVLLEVDSLPGEDGFAVVKRRSYCPGGSGTNVIVQARRLGADCGYIAQVGDDRLGDEILKSLADEGVDVSAMARKRGGVSLHTEIVVDGEGRKFILLDLGDAFLSMGPEALDAADFGAAKVFFTDLLPGPAAIRGLEAAKRAGLVTVVNMQVGLGQMESFGVSKQAILDALRWVDVFSPCREGLLGLAGVQPTDDVEEGVRKAAAVIGEGYRGLLLVTLGKGGSVAFEKGGETRVPICAVKAKDTTGAGDSYIGAFMVARFLDGLGLGEAMAYATACSAITCTGLGARSSPRRAEAEAFLAERRARGRIDSDGHGPSKDTEHGGRKS
jgi:sugar/nucleoside kinase (ribokinase family)